MGAGEPRDDLIETFSIHSCRMEGEGVPIRFPAIAELEVDSRNRYDVTGYGPVEQFIGQKSPYQFSFQSRQSLISGYFNRIALSEFQMQWRTPNVTPRNNKISWLDTEDNITRTVDLPVSFYDLSGLGFAMNFYMNFSLPSPRFRVELRNRFGQDYLRLIQINGFPFRFVLPVGLQANPDTPIICKFYNTAGITTLNENQQVFQDFAFATPLTYTDYIDIVSDGLAKFAKVKDSMTREFQGQTAILARVYLTPFNTKEQYPAIRPFTMAVDYTTPKYIRWNPQEYVNDFDITVYDQYGDILWWDGVNYPWFNTEIQFTLQVSET